LNWFGRWASYGRSGFFLLSLEAYAISTPLSKYDQQQHHWQHHHQTSLPDYHWLFDSVIFAGTK
jgi:hypothetical protein